MAFYVGWTHHANFFEMEIHVIWLILVYHSLGEVDSESVAGSWWGVVFLEVGLDVEDVLVSKVLEERLKADLCVFLSVVEEESVEERDENGLVGG